MDAFVYASCALTSVLCAGLLFRSFHQTRYKLLLWSGLCFAGLALSNLVLVLDKVVFPDINFGNYRLTMAVVALIPLLYGLIFEE
ncbi:MAG TPA: DUF5985 family protein [Methylophilaceae bacterium]|nr:DUF5985 family protein [Methylophilaceae bacterium]